MIIRKFEALIFNIKRDGDRHLRGKIAELIFEKVSSKLFRTLVKNIVICSTSSVRQFLHGIKYCQGELWYKSAFYGGPFKLKDLVDMLPHYKDVLKKESLGGNRIFQEKVRNKSAAGIFSTWSLRSLLASSKWFREITGYLLRVLYGSKK